MLTLNGVAKPPIPPYLSDDSDITSFPFWDNFCCYETDPERLSKLHVQLTIVFKRLSLTGRKKFYNAKTIDNAFTWRLTPQGSVYWMNTNDRICDLKSA